MENLEHKNKKTIDEKAAESFERVATTTERVGIPVATFTIGACVLGISAFYAKEQQINPILIWTGVGLILSSLFTYIWLTERSTTKVITPPPSTPQEMKDIIEWMQNEITSHNQWLRNNMEATNVAKEQVVSDSYNTFYGTESKRENVEKDIGGNEKSEPRT